MRRGMLVFCLSLMLVFATIVTTVADVVLFEDGRPPVEGAASESDGMVIVEKADGTKATYKRSEVQRIEKGKTLMIMYYEKLSKITMDDLYAVYELAVWCDKVGLADKKAVLFIEILKKDPDYELVHRYIGHVMRNGKWVNPSLGEEFGDKIANTLKSGSFADKRGKYFTVRTDTSQDFADFTSKYLDEFCARIEGYFDASFTFKPLNGKPTIVILADYNEYLEVTEEIFKQIKASMGSKNGGIGEKQGEDDEPKKPFVMPPYSCFLDPVNNFLITYRYNKKPNITPLRENIQKLAGYGLFRFGLEGYDNISKSPRFLVEGFASVVGMSYLEGERVVLRTISQKFETTRSLILEYTISYLFNIAPTSYYAEDMSAHSSAAAWVTYFMLDPIRGMPDIYAKAIRQDSSGTLRMESFSKLVGKAEDFEGNWRNFCDSAFKR